MCDVTCDSCLCDAAFGAYVCSVSNGTQGLVFKFKTGEQFVARLSGTGSSGATVRFYFQRELAPGEGLDVDAGAALKEVVTTALKWSDIAAETGRQSPDVIT